MIEELEVECDYIRQVDSQYRDNHIKVVMERVDKSFIADLEPTDIVFEQDIEKLLEAIGAEKVGEWYMSLGGKR